MPVQKSKAHALLTALTQISYGLWSAVQRRSQTSGWRVQAKSSAQLRIS